MNSNFSNTEHQVAVLIDFENVGLRAIQGLFDQISDVGRITIKRAYTDWSAARHTKEQVQDLGIEPVHLFHSTGSGKNSSDIRLVTDALDILYQAPIDTFVIVSSDSDFVPLVSRLRAGGKSVIGAGRRATTSRALVISCDRYIYLDEEARIVNASHSSESTNDSLLVRGMMATMDEEGRVVGSKLNQTLQRLDPSFNFRAMGHSTFTRYLEASGRVSVLRPRGPGDVIVEMIDLAGQSERGPETWGPEIDLAWSKRAPNGGQSIPGPSAAASAANSLGVSKLSLSQYKTLEKLLDASDYLKERWYRDGNTIIRI